MERELTPKQTKFIEVYDGNGTEAARLAGYTGSDNVLGKTAYDLLRNPKIVAAIQSRQDQVISPLIANRERRQEFWTQTMEDSGAELRDRLKASELLGRSEADFVEKHEHTGRDGRPIEIKAVADLQDAEIDAQVTALLAKGQP